MNSIRSASLASYTSLKCGGPAEELYEPDSRDDVIDLLSQQSPERQLWFLGYGSNSLISDEGLPGITVVWRAGTIWHDDNLLVADAGVWWDDLVQYAIGQNLWGLELMSEIPSSVGGAVFGNIAAYGQQVSDTLLWVEVYDRSIGQTRRLDKAEIEFAYRESSLQVQSHLIILQVAFELSGTPAHELRYESARAVAHELNYDISTLEGARNAVIETRSRAGSLYHPGDANAERTAGSFFKNPLVTYDQAKELAKHDESGKTLERILDQNTIHGGSAHRASAALVLLAAGFHRGQQWGNVKLNDKHVLKLETLPGASAREVCDVVQEIISTVHTKLDITITPEVRFLGKF